MDEHAPRPPGGDRSGGTGVPTAMVERATRQWIDTIVVGLALCPFARGALERGLVRVVVSDAVDAPAAVQHLADAAADLLRGDSEDVTTLLVLPDGFEAFDDYLDLVALAEDLLADLGHEGVLQIASFHPDYRFDGDPPDDPAHATNRAPFPTLQLLQEASVARALDGHPDPEGIPERNMAVMRKLGAAGIRALLAPRGDHTPVH